ncbi:MAG: AEC family transporter [Candidatus Subteraquimicrobiales bacterium]|nr:AEC family transporter [Candidatus Subteraquimicrobiales bacterium]
MITLVNIVLSVLALISLGYIAKASGLLKSQDAGILNKVIIYLTLPALIFDKVVNSRVSLEYLKFPLVAFLIMGTSLGLAYLLGRAISLKSKTFGAFLLACAIGNTGYLGYPLTLAIFKETHFVKALFYDLFGTVLFVFTIGLYIAEIYGEDKKKINKVKEIVTFPPLLALVAGLVLRGVILPDFCLRCLEYLGPATIPLIMFSIGLTLTPVEVSRFKIPLILVCLVKLGFSPLLALVIGRFVFTDASSLGIFVLEASMPTVLLSLVIGLKYKLDTGFLAASIFITTLLSILTIPLWQLMITR